MRRHIAGHVHVHVGILAGVMLAVGVGCSSGTDTGPNTDGGVLDAGVDAGTDAGVFVGIRVRETPLVVDSLDAGLFDAGVIADGGIGDGGIGDGGIALPRVDPNLVNPWGMAAGPQTPFWISDNGTGHASIIDGDGGEPIPAVTVPGAPTGVAFNPDTSKFGGDKFLFASEDGTISGWQSGTEATVRIDESTAGAVFKGIAIAGGTLFATNFRSGQVEMFDSNFALIRTFTDPNLPAGFAPFNVAVFNDTVFVTFALQDAQKHDDVAGVGNGFVTLFDASGANPRRLISGGPLNSPWGLAVVPQGFGAASGVLLVGNFGDGAINAFNPASGAQVGQLQRTDGTPLMIDGLWSLHFGNGAAAGPATTLFFTAGPNMEQNGIFGKLEVVSP